MNTWTIHFNESRKKDKKKQRKNVLPRGRQTMEINQEDAKCPYNINRGAQKELWI